MVSKMGLYEELKELEPFTLSCHHDADGIYSATLLRRIFKIKSIEIPAFNEYKTDVAVDLGFPLDKNWSGVCIDHHPDHPEDRKYSLYWDSCPTGKILYDNLKEHIEDKDLWLIVGSLAGDGQAELVPDEIWDKFPVLLQGRGILYQSTYKLGMSNYPLYVFLSSSVNALCRLGFPQDALTILNDVHDPVALLENDAVRDAVLSIRQEEDSIYKSKPIVETFANHVLVRFKSSKPQIRLCGLLGAKLMGLDNNMTYVVLNERNGEVSIRGILSKYIANKLNASGFKAGGHAGFCGATVEETRIEEFMKVVRGI